MKRRSSVGSNDISKYYSIDEEGYCKASYSSKNLMLTREDRSFFKKNKHGASSFLFNSSLDELGEQTKGKNQKKKKKELDKENDAPVKASREEKDYESKPRQSKHWEEEAEKERKEGLPIKLPDGSLKKVRREKAIPEDDTTEHAPLSRKALKKARRAHEQAKKQGEGEPEKEDGEGEEKQEEEEENVEEPEVPKTQDEKKLIIAECGSAIMKDPEANISQLSSLHSFCSDPDLVVAKLAILSETAVFSDIIPGYRIRLPTQKEKEMKVSKEVAKQRKYEAAILKGYQKFLQFLEGYGRKVENKAKDLAQSGDDAAVRGSMLYIVVMSMASLLKKLPHFNFAKNIMQSLIRRLESPVDLIADAALSALKELVDQSILNDTVAECVHMIANVVKERGGKVRPQVLSVFLKLRISSEMLEGGKKKSKQKQDEEEEDLENSLAEGHATVAKEEVKRVATGILESVLNTYFRVLKMQPIQPQLLPPVMEGLSRFAHLINIDFFSDLLQAIKALMIAEDDAGSEEEKGARLSVESSLHSVICVFKCLHNQGEVWDLDLQDFYDVLFRSIPRIASSPSELGNVSLLLEALRMTLFDLRQLSTDRVAGFVKRLLDLSLHVPPQHAMAILSLVRQLFTRYPKARRLLDTEHACVGIYNPEVGNAELSNALASTAWEMNLLACSYHPHQQTAATEVAGMTQENTLDEDRYRALITSKPFESLLKQYDSTKARRRIQPSYQATFSASLDGTLREEEQELLLQALKARNGNDHCVAQKNLENLNNSMCAQDVMSFFNKTAGVQAVKQVKRQKLSSQKTNAVIGKAAIKNKTTRKKISRK
ncbi:hypothetical protein GUITHDRAFT_138771 [Guillardia theta CCMP2712]|uniref:Nucleolar complex protein 3 homolog n=2 Tax=Guillardia theta TaxID=55529 RepID=L1JBP0_GUITC|nr:hypothetical protein GUITHDRAFT_138771 [Guillardia theta CCMP2712]EKX45539.1 hypothetical protein GUITHDRAFT_138771 [Guillardia theta CCMP2712]|eukprot:XP_005832519.1 hypothetical protein GUITHDRAFT_138771 [Guillardia theta CCMP2712]